MKTALFNNLSQVRTLISRKAGCVTTLRRPFPERKSDRSQEGTSRCPQLKADDIDRASAVGRRLLDIGFTGRVRRQPVVRSVY